MNSLNYKLNDFRCLTDSNKEQFDDIQKSIKNLHNKFLIAVNISNISNISSLYGNEFIVNLLDNLLDKIYRSLDNIIIIKSLFSGYFIIIFQGYSDDKTTKALLLYNIIQLFGSETTDNPYHLISFISSIDLNDNQTILSSIQKTYEILKSTPNEAENFYHPYIDDDKTNNLSKKKFILAHCLKNSLVEGKLRFAFQPIIKSDTGQTAHYESLLRIVNVEGKIISAGPFIQIAEEMGFVNLIDDLVLDMVVKELKNHPNINLAFNLSGHGVSNVEWLKKSKKLLSDSDVASRLIVEITETAAQRDLNKSAYFVSMLQDLGCQVALDDFGAGYTSFRQLKILPVDIIKIDGSFIRDIKDNSNNLLFVKTLINMSRSFGFKSVAEFVENGEIAKTLIELKVDYMQGNYFCPAINYRNWECSDI